jgi:plastocyanin
MRIRPLLTVLLALGALALFVAGCGGDDDDEDTTTPTTEAATGATGEQGGGGAAAATSVGMTEYEFDPSDLSVSEGDSLEVTNDGQLPHNLTVEGENVATNDVDPGGSEELTVDLAPGDYDFLCTIGDHAAQGMTGTMTVK